MKGKSNWTHFSFGGCVPMLKRNEKGETTACGKTANRIRVTTHKNNVTCPRCIERLKETTWYCEEHGFLKDEEVNNDECCEYCGRTAIA